MFASGHRLCYSNEVVDEQLSLPVALGADKRWND